MFDENINLEFPVTVYGNLEKYNETISKGRCRIFYKGGNRNGTYITDEFAEKLLSTISYAPVKGIYDNDNEGDYTDHGIARSQGRIYGIVPENPNITWEEHVDDDGVTRVYACVDVLIFTGLYTEANAIVGKSQSMEIYPPSIKGNWKIINGKKWFVFESGHFLGLQVLGDSVEPCFEGAAFFALYQDLKKMVDQIEKYNLNAHNGGKKMLNYKLSDNAKFNALWSLLNVNYSEANNWLIEYDICEIYDEYAVVRNYSEGCFERVYYTKNDETDSVELGDRVRCYIMDVSEAEKTALEALHAMNNNTYEKVDENYQAAKDAVETANTNLATKTEEYNTLNSTYETEKSNFETKIGELNESIATLTTERDDAVSQLTEAQGSINTLTEENATLSSFKAEIEKQQKQAVISKYTDLLDEETLESYSAKIDEYTAKELDKELAYELVSTNQSVFTNGNQNTGYIPKDEPAVGGLDEILSKYQKN